MIYKILFVSAFLSLLFPSISQSSAYFLSQAKYLLALGPLHWLFPLSGILFLQIIAWLTPSQVSNPMSSLKKILL